MAKRLRAPKKFGDTGASFETVTNRMYGSGYDWYDSTRTTTKQQSPYGYDMHYLWGGDEARRRSAERRVYHSVYHDRMVESNRDRWSEACEALRPIRVEQFTPLEASTFLSVYYSKPVKCIALCEGCNVSSGYPYWIFMYVELNADGTEKKERYPEPKKK